MNKNNNDIKNFATINLPIPDGTDLNNSFLKFNFKNELHEDIKIKMKMNISDFINVNLTNVKREKVNPFF